MRRNLYLAFVFAVFAPLGIDVSPLTIQPVQAEDAVDLSSPGAIHRTIELQAGKRVKLRLVSGQELEGKVDRVGTQAVVLSDLTGMEYFSATVALDQVAAVLVRVRSR